jgi:ABC-2 type transport system ATP-binding protein
MNTAISTTNLTKRYERAKGFRPTSVRETTTAVIGVNLAVETGELFGLLGPNGAGKTTLVKMLCTLVAPTEGSAIVAGHPLSESGSIRGAVGLVVSDERSFYWRLSGRRNLEFFAAMHGLYGDSSEDRIADVLAKVDLYSVADKPFSDYSTGMKQRLAIARSLLHKPKILFLDEPSRSLDPKATARLHELIVELNLQEGTTIFLITHDLAEAESLCRRVAVMHQGRIQVVGEPSNLRRQLRPQQRYMIKVGVLSDSEQAKIRDLVPEIQIDEGEEHFLLRFQAGEEDGLLSTLLDLLRDSLISVHGIEGHPPSLDEVFSHFTSAEAVEGDE